MATSRTSSIATRLAATVCPDLVRILSRSGRETTCAAVTMSTPCWFARPDISLAAMAKPAPSGVRTLSTDTSTTRLGARGSLPIIRSSSSTSCSRSLVSSFTTPTTEGATDSNTTSADGFGDLASVHAKVANTQTTAARFMSSREE